MFKSTAAIKNTKDSQGSASGPADDWNPFMIKHATDQAVDGAIEAARDGLDIEIDTIKGAL